MWLHLHDISISAWLSNTLLRCQLVDKLFPHWMEQEHCNGRTTCIQTSLRNTDTCVTIDFSQQHRTKNILLPHKNISILIFPPYSLLTSASGGESDNILESWEKANGCKVAKKQWKNKHCMKPCWKKRSQVYILGSSSRQETEKVLIVSVLSLRTFCWGIKELILSFLYIFSFIAVALGIMVPSIELIG